MYVKGDTVYTIIIGEAKTPQDIENGHTLKQLTSFLSHCALHEPAAFVLAVPWHQSKNALSLLKNCSRKAGINDVDLFVPNIFPG